MSAIQLGGGSPQSQEPGTGLIRRVDSVTFGGNSENRTAVVPVGKLWRIDWCFFEIFTGGTGGNRIVTVQLGNAGVGFNAVMQGAAVDANQGWQVMCSPGLPWTSQAAPVSMGWVPLPVNLWAEAGIPFNVLIAQIDATDVISIMRLGVEEFRAP